MPSSATYVALLRGINVSGKNPIAMAELRASCAALGLSEVRTYLQSGNVVFGAERGDARRLADALHGRIEKDFGHDVAVLVVSAQQLERVASGNPLRPAASADGRLFHCTFLFAPVPQARFHELRLPARDGERAVLAGQTVYLHCPHGYGTSKLNNAYFERALGVQATTRNWRSVLALRELAVGAGS